MGAGGPLSLWCLYARYYQRVKFDFNLDHNHDFVKELHCCWNYWILNETIREILMVLLWLVGDSYKNIAMMRECKVLQKEY